MSTSSSELKDSNVTDALVWSDDEFSFFARKSIKNWFKTAWGYLTDFNLMIVFLGLAATKVIAAGASLARWVQPVASALAEFIAPLFAGLAIFEFVNTGFQIKKARQAWRKKKYIAGKYKEFLDAVVGAISALLAGVGSLTLTLGGFLAHSAAASWPVLSHLIALGPHAPLMFFAAFTVKAVLEIGTAIHHFYKSEWKESFPHLLNGVNCPNARNFRQYLSNPCCA
ncbi:MAG: hypothetical protein JXR42_02580 [Gammaproteobacteria bacterium]|nr:hypothetical protein [Gammaproteobacteria bacterium]